MQFNYSVRAFSIYWTMSMYTYVRSIHYRCIDIVYALHMYLKWVISDQVKRIKFTLFLLFATWKAAQSVTAQDSVGRYAITHRTYYCMCTYDNPAEPYHLYAFSPHSHSHSHSIVALIYAYAKRIFALGVTASFTYDAACISTTFILYEQRRQHQH